MLEREKWVNTGTIVEIPFLIKAMIIGIWLYVGTKYNYRPSTSIRVTSILSYTVL